MNIPWLPRYCLWTKPGCFCAVKLGLEHLDLEDEANARMKARLLAGVQGV